MLTYMGGGMLVSPLNKKKNRSSCSHNNLTISDCEHVQLYINIPGLSLTVNLCSCTEIYLDYL